MISQLFMLSLRGDSIIFRDYRADVPKTSSEIFFRKYKFWNGDGDEAPPVFTIDGVHYLFIKGSGLLFVATTRVNVSPSLILELLQRIARIVKDYLGVLNEESLRKNFVLVYELLDEVVDFGYPQSTSTEALKSFVFNEPIPVVDNSRVLAPIATPSIFLQGVKRVPGTAVTQSVVATDTGGKKREEIFVDIIERISVTFSANGYISTSEIDGTIQMKSYLVGNPEIKIALSEDLTIARGGDGAIRNSFSTPNTVVLDDCNFYERVRLDDFDLDRTLTLVPPDGEFSLMNYRITQEFKPPFRVYPIVEEAGPFKADILVRVRSEFPASTSANAVTLQIPLPKSTTRVSVELEKGSLGGQSTDFKESTKVLEWTLKKITGGSEHILKLKLSLSQERVSNLKKETGPINMSFAIPMYNASRLQVRYLQVLKKAKTYNPYRWVRYVTQSNSYVIRL